MNWERQINSELERALCSDAFGPVLSFLQSMPSSTERYASKKRQRKLEAAVTAVMLNALDAYVINSMMAVSKDAEQDEIWGEIDTAVNALEVTGQLSVSRDQKPDTLEVTLSPSDSARRIKATILDHSQPLDVHRWSDHPETNVFVDEIYARYFEGGNSGIRKRHLKVVLLDLYVRWAIDPTLKTAVSLNVDSYQARSRYNAIHLSKLTIEIVERLAEVGLIDLVKGFYDRINPENSRDSRIWPRSELTRLFVQARFGIMDVSKHPGEEVIILRAPHPQKPKKQIEVDYTDDDKTNGMRNRLRAYNALITSTFVDIPTLETPLIELAGDKRLHVNQSDKFTRRVFNRGVFDKGGRFYGGWWQRCPKEVRKGIFLDDKPTVEIDFSGLHIVTLYANKGIDYWQEVGTDPYELHLPEWAGPVPRSVCKLLMLVSINAKDETSAFQAYRSEAETGPDGKGASDEKLRAVLNGLRKKHTAICENFANDAGINLMKQDGDITDRILTTFTEAGIPILSIHDSYIVPIDHQQMLFDVMQQAYLEVTGKANPKVAIGDLLPPAMHISYHPLPRLPELLFCEVNGKYVAASEFEKRLPTKIFDKSDRYKASLAAFRNQFQRM